MATFVILYLLMSMDHDMDVNVNFEKRVIVRHEEVEGFTSAEQPFKIGIDQTTKVFTDSENNLMTVSLFAKEAGVTPQAVRKMIAEQRVKASLLGEQYVISRDELDRYLSR